MNQAILDRMKAKLLSIARDGKSFVSAATSSSLSDEARDGRLEVCRQCEKVQRDGEKLYCGACHCPRWRLSELSVKTRMARAHCPLNRWPGEPATAAAPAAQRGATPCPADIFAARLAICLENRCGRMTTAENKRYCSAACCGQKNIVLEERLANGKFRCPKKLFHRVP